MGLAVGRFHPFHLQFVAGSSVPLEKSTSVLKPNSDCPFSECRFFVRPCWCTSKSTMTSFRWFIWTMWFLPRWRILVAWSRGFIHFLWLWIASWSHKSRTLYPAGSLGLSSRVAWKMNPKSWGIGLNSEAVLPSADWRLTSFSYYRHLKSCKSEDREQVQGTVGTTGQVGAIENRQVRD